MSRDRENKRKKRDELARQLGVGRADVEQQRDLETRERVSRPAVRLVAQKPVGILRRLLDRTDPLVVAVYLVEQKGPRLLEVIVLSKERHQLAKVTYHRPAHFIVVALAVPDAATASLLVDALSTSPATAKALLVDGEELSSPAFATAAWEVPRRARIDGLLETRVGAALSIRGVARSAVRHALPLERTTATIEIEI